MFFLFLSRSMKRRGSNKKRKKMERKRTVVVAGVGVVCYQNNLHPVSLYFLNQSSFFLCQYERVFFFFILCNTYACSKGIFIIRLMFLFASILINSLDRKKKETNVLYCTIIINCKYCSKNCRTTCKVSFTYDIRKTTFFTKKVFGY